MFGGDPGGPPLADTWAWDGSLWTQVADTGPSARRSMSLSEHGAAGAKHLVLFGGASGATFLGDTWVYDGTDWMQVADTGPKARGGHATASDPVRQRLVLFGGDNGGRLGDTWEWNGTEWTQVADTGPSARRGHSMAFDVGRGKVILFGGAGADGKGLNDTWAWDGTAWTQITDTGPDPRAEAAMAGDASLLLFGGVSTIDVGPNAGVPLVYGDTWRLTAQGWEMVQDIGPAPRWGHAATAAKVGAAPGRVVLFGGATTNGPAEDAALIPGLLGDTWEVPDVAVTVAGTAAALQITSVQLQPPTASPFPNSAPMTVIVTTNVPPPAGSSPAVAIARGPAPWAALPGYFFATPVVTFNGAQTTITFNIVRDGSFLQPGQYAVRVAIGTAQAVFAPFSV